LNGMVFSNGDHLRPAVNVRADKGQGSTTAAAEFQDICCRQDIGGIETQWIGPTVRDKGFPRQMKDVRYARISQCALGKIPSRQSVSLDRIPERFEHADEMFADEAAGASDQDASAHTVTAGLAHGCLNNCFFFCSKVSMALR